MAGKNNWLPDYSEKVADSNANQSLSGEGLFEIHVIGQLDSRWSEWLEGLEIKLLENGEMMLIGTIVDQASLMGILNKLNLLNLTLISVNKVNRKTKEFS
jgi:hypothetical protein